MLATIQIKGIGLTADWIYMLFSKSITDKAVSLTRISYDWNEPNTQISVTCPADLFSFDSSQWAAPPSGTTYTNSASTTALLDPTAFETEVANAPIYNLATGSWATTLTQQDYIINTQTPTYTQQSSENKDFSATISLTTLPCSIGGNTIIYQITSVQGGKISGFTIPSKILPVL